MITYVLGVLDVLLMVGIESPVIECLDNVVHQNISEWFSSLCMYWHQEGKGI